MKALASHTDNLARVNSVEGRARSNLGSDGRSTRESESSEGSGELRHDSVQTTTIYESLAAELRAKLGEYSLSELLPLFLFDAQTLYKRRSYRIHSELKLHFPIKNANEICIIIL